MYILEQYMPAAIVNMGDTEIKQKLFAHRAYILIKKTDQKIE